jgi:hypothetical protein
VNGVDEDVRVVDNAATRMEGCQDVVAEVPMLDLCSAVDQERGVDLCLLWW